MQYVLSGVRLLWPDPVQPPDMNRIQTLMGRLGQPLYGRSTPDGYPPDTAYWNGSGQMDSRFQVARQLTAIALAQGSSLSPTSNGSSASAAALPAAESSASRRESERKTWALLKFTLTPRTQRVLDDMATPRERLTLLLASPEFMSPGRPKCNPIC